MSDRLAVYSGGVACNSCDSLRGRIAELQARMDALTLELSQTRDRSNHSYQAPSVSSLPVTGSLPAEPLQGPLDTPYQSRTELEPASESHVYSGRILRPTFVGGRGKKDIDADVLGSAWSLWHNDTSVGTPGQALTKVDDVPIVSYGAELIDVFFARYWAHLPILHQPTFLEKDYYPVSQGLAARPFSRFQVYMVFAIAACETPMTTTGYNFSPMDFFQKAIETLATVMLSDELDLVQCLLLLCLFGRNEPQRVDMWHTTGLALRIATGIDLHRKESVTKGSLLETEMTKRLFWSVYVMDRSMAMALGRPLGIEDADITLPLPLQFTDEQLAESIETQLSTPSASVETKDTSAFIHVIKLRRLNAITYKTFHAADQNKQRKDLEPARTDLYRELNEWLITAPRYLSTESMFQSTEWWQIAYSHAVLSLYRPSYASPVPSFEGLRLCADSSISLISLYASLYAKNKVSYSFIALNSIFMAAVTMLYSLRASPVVRNTLTKPVVETNIASCLSLFRGISSGREIAEKCSQVVSRLGEAVLALFEKTATSDRQVDLEFLSWFGLKSQREAILSNGVQSEIGNAGANLSALPPENDLLGSVPTPSIDAAWGDLFAEGFDWETAATMDFFPITLQ